MNKKKYFINLLILQGIKIINLLTDKVSLEDVGLKLKFNKFIAILFLLKQENYIKFNNNNTTEVHTFNKKETTIKLILKIIELLQEEKLNFYKNKEIIQKELSNIIEILLLINNEILNYNYNLEINNLLSEFNKNFN